VRAVIADTGPLYASFDTSDQYHKRAQLELRELQQQKLGVLVTYPTVLESYSLVLQRFNTRLAQRFLQTLRSGTTVVKLIDRDYLNAMQLVSSYLDQKITLFDGLTAIVSKRLSLPIWTYDYHFDIMGVQVWR